MPSLAHAKGGSNTEKLNIVGKRSGDGFVAHKGGLVAALGRALAGRIELAGVTIGRKGFLTYLKALGGSNVVKVVPGTSKMLKVVCGANTSCLDNDTWIGDKTPMTFCQVEVSPSVTVCPNLGAVELAEALARVLPFTLKGIERPVLRCILFTAKDGKLTMASTDGFRLAVFTLDYEGEGTALIYGDDLKGVVSALKRAKRARLSFVQSGNDKPSRLVIDTELIRYEWRDEGGTFPNYGALIPTEFKAAGHFDTSLAMKAVTSLLALADAKGATLDISIADGKLVITDPDGKGQAEIVAETEGEMVVRLSGGYLADALKACGGMVDLKIFSPASSVLFGVDGYQLVVMPVFRPPKAEGGAKAEPVADVVAQAEGVVAEAEGVVAQAEAVVAQAEAVAQAPETEAKPKRKRKAKELVAVA